MGGLQACAFVDHLLGAGREIRADFHCEVSELVAAGEFSQAFLDQLAGTAEVTLAMSDPRAQKGELWAAERRMGGQPVEAVLFFGPGQPVQQQVVPFREVAGSLA
ncbi:MAG: hypothetical protein ACRDOH_34840, partial [Streptosporangiaceae bacterium]